jgi:hypothetical protein
MKTELGLGMRFSNKKLEDIYEWFLKEILSKVWMDHRFQSCAKGGRWKDRQSFEEKKDMPYLAHIISGSSMVLRVIDIGLSKGEFADIPDLEFKLKRALIGFLFHDFNKLTNSDFKMSDSSILSSLINELKFNEILKEFSLDDSSLYDLAIATEIGTRYHALGRSQDPSLRFEKEVIKNADKLSSVFNNPNPYLDENLVIWGFTFKKDNIKSIKLRPSIFYALTDLIKLTLIDFINEKGMKYLWTTEFTIYYYSEGKTISLDKEIERISKDVFARFIDNIDASKGIKFNDRKISNPAKGIIKFNDSVIDEFLKRRESFLTMISPTNNKIDSKFEDILNEFRNSVLNLKSIQIDLKKDSGQFVMKEMIKVNDAQYITDNEILNERRKIFVVRTLQLEFNDIKLLRKEDKKSLERLYMELEKFIENEKRLLQPFIDSYKGEVQLFKSPFVAILFVAKSSIDDKIYIEALHEILDTWNSNAIELEEKIQHLVKYITGVSSLDIQEVPDKSEMAVVTGYKATRRGLTENTFGINTNSSFTNKVITSKKPNFNIDDNYAIEALLRKNLTLSFENKSEFSTTLIYLTFPGAVAYLNIHSILIAINNSKYKLLELGKIENLIKGLEIGLDSVIGNRNDNTYFIDLGEISSNEEAINILYNSLNLIELTQLKCLITESNTPPIENQKEIFRMETKKFIVGDLKWDRIRCNEVAEIKSYIDLLSFISKNNSKKNKSKGNSKDKNKISEILLDFVKNPLSLFHYVKRNLLTDPEWEKRLFLERYNGRPIYDLINDFIFYYSNQAQKEVVNKMKEIEELANIAYDLIGKRYLKSTNERTWMLRDSLDALEKLVASFSEGKRDLYDFKDIISGRIAAGLKRENPYLVNPEKIDKFSEALINMIKNSFNGKIPAGAIKSYIIDAFEFDLMKKYYNSENQAGGVQ